MMKNLLILLLAIATYVYGAGFAVVAPGGTSVSVKIGTNSYPMTRLYADVDYFTVVVTTPAAPFTYKYTVNTVDETFDRTFATTQGSQTYNEFYGRKDTVKAQYTMGYPFSEQNKWTRKLGPNGVYDDDYISTVFITGGNGTATADSCFSKDGTNCYGTFTTTIISKYDIGRSPSTVVSTKAGYEPKIQMNLYVSSYRGRYSYKLRPSAYDPSFIRERIYNDVLEACGCPHQETSHTRVYVGSKPLGLYYLQEITGSSDFIQTQFYAGDWQASLGSIYECSTGADFYPNGVYNFKLANAGPAPVSPAKEDITALINKVGTLNFASDSEIAAFNTNWLDLNTYLRAVAVQFLTANWDGYLFYTSNFVMYRHPGEGTTGTYKFYFVDQDFDQTFGVAITANDDMSGYESNIGLPYTTFVNKVWSNGGAPSRVLFNGLLSNPTWKAKWEATLKTIVKSIFNPNALGKRITEVKARIADEVKWDRELGANRIRQGCIQPQCNSITGEYQSYQYTYADFTNSFDSNVRGDIALNTWVSQRASSIQTQLSVGAYDNPPLESTPNYGTSSGMIITPGSTTNVLTTSQLTTVAAAGTSNSAVTSGTVTAGSAASTTAQAGQGSATSGSTPASGATTSQTPQSQSTTGVEQQPSVTTSVADQTTETTETTESGQPDTEASSAIQTFVSFVFSFALIAFLF